MIETQEEIQLEKSCLGKWFLTFLPWYDEPNV